MKIIKTPLSGLYLIEPKTLGDERGFFLETFRNSWLEDLGHQYQFVQDNWSRSTKGVLRGLHFQNPNPQGKLVRVTHGSIFDVAVDLRKSSSTLGQWYGAELNTENKNALFIPPGFGHGFYVLSDITDVFYKCTDYYYAPQESGISYSDPEIGIIWPFGGAQPQLSQRDKNFGSFKDYLNLG